ncbi:hypothetical protein L2E82_18702 [Cichorium intybus]|uniref:Uncharacterized protein n=1 Tax=Cichorium intybus TaxID=13427 RepID=A0ACB9FAB3_CICIN|nr:hypothetical protein L2E82_18702 [Cichorium intybus]
MLNPAGLEGSPARNLRESNRPVALGNQPSLRTETMTNGRSRDMEHASGDYYTGEISVNKSQSFQVGQIGLKSMELDVDSENVGRPLSKTNKSNGDKVPLVIKIRDKIEETNSSSNNFEWGNIRDKRRRVVSSGKRFTPYKKPSAIDSRQSSPSIDLNRDATNTHDSGGLVSPSNSSKCSSIPEVEKIIEVGKKVGI